MPTPKMLDHAAIVARRKGVGRAPDELSERIDAYNERHHRDDLSWLAAMLHDKGASGDRRARRLLSRFALRWTKAGARIPAPTWKPIWHPSRRAEIE